MLVVMEQDATEVQVERVLTHLAGHGLEIQRLDAPDRTIIGIASGGPPQLDVVAAMEGVHEVLAFKSPYKLANRTYQANGTLVRLGDTVIGGTEVVVMAGPCLVQSEAQIFGAAAAVRRAGGRVLCADAFGAVTSPYGFQGLGIAGLELLCAAAAHEGLKTASEVMDAAQIDTLSRFVDILEVGAQNMQNFTLLRELGRARTPVVLKRGNSATIEEWLLAAEYVLCGGNSKVVLCECGIRTFERYTSNTLDLSAIQAIKTLSHLPVLVDPSHGTGRQDHVAPMSRAALAAGADGLIIEIQFGADGAGVDVDTRSVGAAQFADLMSDLRVIAPAFRRTICPELVSVPF
jgi:3-deoxy-7-phosphoheptulonate synthase